MLLFCACGIPRCEAEGWEEITSSFLVAGFFAWLFKVFRASDVSVREEDVGME